MGPLARASARSGRTPERSGRNECIGEGLNLFCCKPLFPVEACGALQIAILAPVTQDLLICESIIPRDGGDDSGFCERSTLGFVFFTSCSMRGVNAHPGSARRPDSPGRVGETRPNQRTGP